MSSKAKIKGIALLMTSHKRYRKNLKRTLRLYLGNY